MPGADRTRMPVRTAVFETAAYAFRIRRKIRMRLFLKYMPGFDNKNLYIFEFAARLIFTYNGGFFLNFISAGNSLPEINISILLSQPERNIMNTVGEFF